MLFDGHGFRAPRQDGVVQVDWHNLLAEDFSLVASWYVDTLPPFVTAERLERLRAFLEYIDLTQCHEDPKKITLSPLRHP